MDLLVPVRNGAEVGKFRNKPDRSMRLVATHDSYNASRYFPFSGRYTLNGK